MTIFSTSQSDWLTEVPVPIELIFFSASNTHLRSKSQLIFRHGLDVDWSYSGMQKSKDFSQILISPNSINCEMVKFGALSSIVVSWAFPERDTTWVIPYFL